MAEQLTIRGYIGTYTKKESKGIYTFQLNLNEKKLENVELAAEVGSPTYLTISADKQYLYAVAKRGEQGGAAAFTVNTENGILTSINEELSDGVSPCHISVDQANQHVITANYHKGTIELQQVASDGSLKPISSLIKHEAQVRIRIVKRRRMLTSPDLRLMRNLLLLSISVQTS